MIKKLWDKFQNDPSFLRKFHGWATVVWFVAAIPICFFLSSSVPFLVFISVYAVVASHWASWQASRIEEIEADVDELEEEVEEKK